MIVIYSTSPLSSAVDAPHASTSPPRQVLPPPSPQSTTPSPAAVPQLPSSYQCYQQYHHYQHYLQRGRCLQNLKICWSPRLHRPQHTPPPRLEQAPSANISNIRTSSNSNITIYDRPRSISCPPVARVTMVTDSPSTHHLLRYQHPAQIKFALLPTGYHNQQHRGVLIVLPLHHSISPQVSSTPLVSSVVEQPQRHHYHQQHQHPEQQHRPRGAQLLHQTQPHAVYQEWYNGVPIRSPVLQYLYPPAAAAAATTMAASMVSTASRSQGVTVHQPAAAAASWYPRLAALYHPSLYGTVSNPYLGGLTASPRHPLQLQQACLQLQQQHQQAYPRPLAHQGSPYNGVPPGWFCINPYLVGRTPRPCHILSHPRPRHKGPV